MRHLIAIIMLLLAADAGFAEMRTDIEYGKAGDAPLLLDANIPDDPGPHPVAILVHGGGWNSGDKAADFKWLRQPLTDAKFTWFSVNYRLAPKYHWPACYDDVQTAIKWVKANAAQYKGDPKRIALIGYSAGGQLVCLSAVKATVETRVQAIVGYAPPTDFELDLPTRGGLSKSLMDLLDRPHELTDESRKMLIELSAIHFVKPGLPPFLLIHGTADKSVPYQGSLNFQAKLKEVGVPCELITLEGAQHNSATWDKADTTYAAKTIAWLKRTLGESKPAGDSSATRAAREPGVDAIVAADGTGNFKTVQDAINASPQSNPPRKWVIQVKPGTYKEIVYIQREKRLVHLVGDDAEKTIITYGLYAGLPGADGKPMGTFRTPTAQIDADQFTIENITFENSAGPKGQALAVRIDGDEVTFKNCRFLGWQDTVFTNRGRHYFKDCYIAGATDFIFGGGTDFFDHCHIHCVGNGYITAASTPQSAEYGYVFDHCTIDGEPGVKTYLGRPWRPFAATVFLHTEMSEAVRPVGWNNWGRADREKTARYAEFDSSGAGGNSAARVRWAKQLNAEEAGKITPQAVLGSFISGM
jgi:pectinesterase